MTVILLKRGTAAEWVAANPVLANGEPGYETDTGKEKRGDGTKTWNALDYFLPKAQLTAMFAGSEDSFLSAKKNGVVGDGVANDVTALTTAAASATTKKLPLLLSGTSKLSAKLTLPTAPNFISLPGSSLRINHTGQGIEIAPTGSVVGTSRATAIGSSTMQLQSNPAWGTNIHVGKLANVYDPAVNPVSLDPAGTVQVRRVIGNTGDTLAFEYGYGYAVPVGCTVTLFDPMKDVSLKKLKIERLLAGSADLIVRYVDGLDVDGLVSINAGDYSAASGNAVSIYHCSDVEGKMIIEKAGNFGVFVYNSDRVNIKTNVHWWGGDFGTQLKDCRESRFTVHAEGDGTVGDNGVSIKSSGVNSTHDVVGVGCRVSKAHQTALELSSIVNEGTYYHAVDLWYEDSVATNNYAAGFATVSQSGSEPRSWGFKNCDSRKNAQSGFSTGKRLSVLDCTAYLNGQEGLRIDAADVFVRGGEYRDNVQNYVSGATYSSEIYLGAASARVVLHNPVFRRTSEGKSIRALRELSGASMNLVKDPKIIEEVSSFTQDYLLQAGSGTRVIGSWDVDKWTSTSVVINKLPLLPITLTTTLDFPTVVSGDSTYLLVTVPGAAINDVVSLGLPINLRAGLAVNAWVSAADTVAVRITNATSGSLSPLAGTYRIAVTKL